MGKINMKFLIECNTSSVWVVSKASFLIALVEVAKYKQRKVFAHLSPRCKGAVGQEEFGRVIGEYDPNISTENTEKLFEEAKRREETAGVESVGEVICQ